MTDSQKQQSIIVGSRNIISQLLFVWVFRFIAILRKVKDIKEIVLELKETETSELNDKILNQKWIEEVEAAEKKNR